MAMLELADCEGEFAAGVEGGGEASCSAKERHARRLTTTDTQHTATGSHRVLATPTLTCAPIPGTVLPTTGAICLTCAINSSNWSGYSDCMPSDKALSGSPCTSMMRPSAPTATAA